MLKFTEEKLGQAERTELDAHLENLLAKSESTKHWTEKILKQTEVLLQPNPSTRNKHSLVLAIKYQPVLLDKEQKHL